MSSASHPSPVFADAVTVVRGKPGTPLARAHHVATTLQHSYVGTEHLLPGLLEQSDGLAWHTVQPYGVTPTVALDAVQHHFGRHLGTPATVTPWIRRVRRVLEHAEVMAAQERHRPVSTGHLLAALIDAGASAATQILTRFGVDDAAQFAILQMLQDAHYRDPPVPDNHPSS